MRYTWRCKSCFKLTTGFAIPYGKCFMCGGELEVIPGRDLGDSMRFRAIRDAVQFELDSFHFYKLARDKAAHAGAARGARSGSTKPNWTTCTSWRRSTTRTWIARWWSFRRTRQNLLSNWLFRGIQRDRGLGRGATCIRRRWRWSAARATISGSWRANCRRGWKRICAGNWRPKKKSTWRCSRRAGADRVAPLPVRRPVAELATDPGVGSEGYCKWAVNVSKEEPDQSFGLAVPLSEEYLRAHTVGGLTPLSSAIRIVDYDPQWPRRFDREAGKIRSVLADRALRVEHVGSTAVPGLPAKPVIDMVLVVADPAEENGYAGPLEKIGYRLHIREPGWHEHRMFKGPEQDVNLHVFSASCPEIARMLAFRDRLRSSESDRELYGRSKPALAQREWKYTQNYADAKTTVIEEIMSRALLSATSDDRASCDPTSRPTAGTPRRRVRLRCPAWPGRCASRPWWRGR